MTVSAPGVTAVPVKETTCGLPIAESVMVIDPVRLPGAVGLKASATDAKADTQRVPGGLYPV